MMKQEEDSVLQPSFWKEPLNWLWTKPQEWLYYWRFRHNPTPGPGFEPVQEAQGRIYWLKQPNDQTSTIKVWRLYYRGEQVGEANGLRFADEDNFDVGNLEVDPAHRGRRLGSILLRRIEAEAHQQGAAFVTGRVVARDAAAFPGLLAWYQAQGYDVEKVAVALSMSGTQDVARIRKAVDVSRDD